VAGFRGLRRKWIGARARRVEDARLLTGEAIYVADVALPGMLHAAFLRSPHPHARILSVNEAAARQLPGVVSVITGRELAIAPLTDVVTLEGLRKTPQPLLAADRVRFTGEAIAAVVAESRYVAEDAVEQILVDFEPLPPVPTVESALSDRTILFDELGTNVIFRETRVTGDVESAFAKADHVFRDRYHTNRCIASPMEMRGCLAQYQPYGDKLTFWSSTQVPHVLRTNLASKLGIPENKIRVIAPEVGGAFGQKQSIYPEELVVAYLATRLRKPVRWIEDRRENFVSASHSKEQVVEVEAAIGKDGKVLALRARFIGDGGAYSFNPASLIVEPSLAAMTMPGVYQLENYEYEVIGVVTNKTPVGPYRGVGCTAGQTAREMLFDDIASGLGIDPVDFRRRNMVRSEQFPFEACSGMIYDSGSFIESLGRCADSLEYSKFRTEQGRLRNEGRFVGVGISPYVEATGWGSEMGIQTGFPVPSHDSATVSMDPSGKVTVAVGVSSHGQGHETSLAQVAADILGVDLEDVAVVHGDTDVAPYGLGTYASRSAIVGGGSVSLAAMELRSRILQIAGRLLEAAPQDLIAQDGHVFARNAEGRSLTMAEVANAAYFDSSGREDGESRLLQITRLYEPRATYSNGCVGATVEVDVETGSVRIDRIVVVEDCGTILNPMIVDGQVHGGVVQGIGNALYEELVYDGKAQPLFSTLMDYLLPTAAETPLLDVLHIESPSPVTVGGMKGMGEAGMIASPAAILIAVVDALRSFDPQVHELPLSPDRIVAITRPGANAR
jgi:carbon-monoxide dehydrogenase large subunit